MRNEFSVAIKNRRRSLTLAAFVWLSLLFAQGAELSHSHDNDPRVRYDCDICLKLGSSDDIPVAGHVHDAVPPIQYELLESRAELPFLPLLDLRSRSPPQA